MVGVPPPLLVAPDQAVHPRDRQQEVAFLQIGIAVFKVVGGWEGVPEQRLELGDLLPVPILLFQEYDALVAAIVAENAGFHGEIEEILLHLIRDGMERDGTFDLEPLLRRRQDDVCEICKAELLEFPLDPRPVKRLSEVLHKEGDVEVHPDSRARPADVLGDVRQKVQEMEFRLIGEAVSVPDVWDGHGVLENAAEIGDVVGLVRDVHLHDVGVHLVVLRSAAVGIDRLVVGLARVVEGSHQLVAPLPILRADDEVDIAVGTKLRHGVVILHHEALHHEVVDARLAELFHQRLHLFAAADVEGKGVEAAAAHAFECHLVGELRPAHVGVGDDAGGGVDARQAQKLPGIILRQKLRLPVRDKAFQYFQVRAVYGLHVPPPFVQSVLPVFRSRIYVLTIIHVIPNPNTRCSL